MLRHSTSPQYQLAKEEVREITAAGLIALAIAIGIGRFAFTPLLPLMQDDAAITIGEGGWLAAANYGGYLLGALMAIGVPLRATIAIRIGVMAIAATTIAMGVTSDFLVWLGLRSVAGVASAWVVVFTVSWCLAQLTPLRRPMLNSSVFSGVGAGIMVTGLVVVVLMHLRVNSSQSWLVFGVLALVMALPVWRAFDESESSSRADIPRHDAGVCDWNADSVRLVVCYAAFGFGYIIPATFLPAMAKQVASNPLVFGWSWPVFGLAAMGSTLLAALISKSIGNRRIWIASQMLMAVGVALPAVWPSIASMIMAALCVGGTFMVITMAGLQEARALAGTRARSLIAAMTAAFAIGQIAGPVSITYMAEMEGGFTVGLLTASALLVISAYALFQRSNVEVHMHRTAG